MLLIGSSLARQPKEEVLLAKVQRPSSGNECLKNLQALVLERSARGLVANPRLMGVLFCWNRSCRWPPMS